MPLRSCWEHNGHTVRNLDTPGIGRDIMTYLLDRDRAIATLAEIEPTWGGDIETRMAATAAEYRALHTPSVAAIATRTDAVVPTDSAPVQAESAAVNAEQQALATGGANITTPAEDPDAPQ